MRSSKTIHVAAVDLGATSGRVILGKYIRGKLELQEAHRFSNKFTELGKHCYWDLGTLWEEVRIGLAAAVKKAPRLASIGVDVWGCDCVLTNDAGRLVFPTHAYRDRRTEPYFRKLAKSGLPRVYSWTGIANLSYNTSHYLSEIVDTFPLITDIATRCLWLPDYFNFLLSGKMENEISVVSTSQLLDVHGTEMSKAALNHFKLPESWFSKPALSPKKLGRVKGLPGLEKTMVTLVPGHDTSCAYDAMPAAEDGMDIYISSGTWSLIGFESDKPVLGRKAMQQAVSNERLGDGRYRPLKSCLGMWLLEQLLPAFSQHPKSARDWNQLIRAAEKAPMPETLIRATDRALFNPDDMKRAIDNHLRKRGARPPKDLAGYTRVICESLGQGHADAVRSFEKMTGRKFNRILMVGGGSKNRLLCQATANRARIPVVSFALEGTAVGNMANQLVSLGAVEDLRTFRRGLARRLDQTEYLPH